MEILDQLIDLSNEWKIESSSISILIKVTKISISFLLIHSFSHNLSHKESNNKNENNSWNIFNLCYMFFFFHN